MTKLENKTLLRISELVVDNNTMISYVKDEKLMELNNFGKIQTIGRLEKNQKEILEWIWALRKIQ